MSSVHKRPADAENMVPNTGIFEEELLKQEALKAAEVEKKEVLNAFASVMETKAGRKAMAVVLASTGIAESVSNRDAIVMAMLSARRDVGVTLLAILKEAAPEKINLMREENDGI